MIRRGRGQSRAAAMVGVAALLLIVPPVPAQTCPGDCTGDQNVGVAELIQCVNIALGNTPAASCAACDANASGTVMVDDLIASVNAVLSGCALAIAGEGLCLRPGPQGLEPCAEGTVVRVLRCDDPNRCLTDPAATTVLDLGAVAAGGAFTLRIDRRAAAGRMLIFEADVEPATDTTYRVMDLGPASASGGLGGAAGLASLLIDPISEAAVRLLDDNGLENFSAEGVEQVIDAVRAANDDTSFAGVGAAAGAVLATDTAAADPVVEMTLDRLAMTPTPTRTATPTAPPPTDVDITGEGVVQVSSVFGADEFPAALAIDGDRTTSWFSDGSTGGDQETYLWVGARDDRVVSVAVLSNAQHAVPDFRRFGFARLRITVVDANVATVFETERELPGATDPDIVVMPDVVGRAVEVRFIDHDDPSCGGFSELRITARR